MKICQTISLDTSLSKMQKTLQFIKANNVSMVRFNMCKYPQHIMHNKLDLLIELFQRENLMERIILDIPFPYNKTRIIDIQNIDNKTIKTGDICNICFDKALFHKQSGKAILIPPPQIYNKNNIVYYGDGDGAFKILHISPKIITLQSLSNFEIWEGKTITIGLVESGIMHSLVKQIDTLRKYVAVTLALSLLMSSRSIDLLKLRMNSNIDIMAKIETPSSLKDLEGIAKVCDSIMIARGDLALLNDYTKLVAFQKHIVNVAQKNHVPVFIATDVLRSLSKNYIPSRADIVDLTHMIQLGCSGIILKNNSGLINNLSRVSEVIDCMSRTCKQE